MKRSIRIPLIYLAIIILFMFVFFIFTVKNTKDCNKFVIESYENASHINIPKVTFADCFYLEEEQIRTGIYTIDTIVTNLDKYTEEFGFSKTNFAQNGILWTQDFLLGSDALIPEENGDFYYSEGKNEKSIWLCLLDKNTGKMWFQIKWLEE